jgi:hypothetical protein
MAQFSCTQIMLLLHGAAWWATLALLINFYKTGKGYEDSYNLGYVTQIAEDWTVSPFTDIVLVGAGQDCPISAPDLVIYEIWKGAASYCDCFGFEDPKYM